MDTKRTNEEREITYEELKDIISRGRSNEIIRKDIEKQFQGDPIVMLTAFSRAACRTGDLKVAEKLFEIYRDKFEEHDPILFTDLALQLEGIHELMYFDARQTWRLSGSGDFSTRDQNLLPKIYCLSKDVSPVLIVGETGTSKASKTNITGPPGLRITSGCAFALTFRPYSWSHR